MRILVLGAGGIGGYFGGRLAAAGVDVRFLVRPSRAHSLMDRGMVIRSPLGDVETRVETLTQANTTVDAILLACKAYDLEGAIDAIAPAVGAHTRILPLLNGLRHLDRLDARFGQDHVLGGLCHIGVAVDAAGTIEHLNTLQRFVLGARTTAQSETVERLHTVLARGCFEPILSEAILQEMWEKFVFLASYAGMTTLMRAPISAILSTQEGEAITREMLDECVAIAAANGYAPRPAVTDRMLSDLTQRGSTGTASMFRDIVQGAPTEHEHILGDMLARARSKGVQAPLLRVSLAHMQAYETVRSGSAVR